MMTVGGARPSRRKYPFMKPSDRKFQLALAELGETVVVHGWLAVAAGIA
jgi:hypothetical protein